MKLYSSIFIIPSAVVIVLLVGWWFYANRDFNFRKSVPSSSPVPIHSEVPFIPKTETDDVSQAGENWNIYTNKQFGYSIKYPYSWYIDTEYAGYGDAGNAIHISNIKDPEKYLYLDGIVSSSNKPDDLYVLTLSLIRPTPGDTLDEAVEKLLTDARIYGKQNIKIGELEGIRAVVSFNLPESGEDSDIKQTVTIIKAKNFALSFGFPFWKQNA